MRKALFCLIAFLGLHVNLYGALLSYEERDYLDKKREITMCIDPNWLPFEQNKNNEHRVGFSGSQRLD